MSNLIFMPKKISLMRRNSPRLSLARVVARRDLFGIPRIIRCLFGGCLGAYQSGFQAPHPSSSVNTNAICMSYKTSWNPEDFRGDPS